MVVQERERQAAEAAKPKRVGAVPPSRIPREWRPQQALPPAMARPLLPAPKSATVPVPVAPASEAAGTALTAPEEGAEFEREFHAWLKQHRINIPADATQHVWDEYRRAFKDFNHHDRFLRLSS